MNFGIRLFNPIRFDIARLIFSMLEKILLMVAYFQTLIFFQN
jgi:hypothetical protein